MLELKNGNCVITISELWGPFSCEYKKTDCEKNSFAFVLAGEEYRKLNEKSGSKMVKLILDNKLGRVICEKCLEKMILEIGILDPIL